MGMKAREGTYKQCSPTSLLHQAQVWWIRNNGYDGPAKGGAKLWDSRRRESRRICRSDLKLLASVSKVIRWVEQFVRRRGEELFRSSLRNAVVVASQLLIGRHPGLAQPGPRARR